MRKAIRTVAASLGLIAVSASAQPAAPDGAEKMVRDLEAAALAQIKADEPLEVLVKQSGFSGTIEKSQGRLSQSWIFSRDKLGKDDKGYNSNLWRWASVTKQVIAVLILQEVGKGTIDLDQPVAKYLPKFASPNAAKITVRQLLRHQSGLPNPDDTAANDQTMAAYYLPGYKGNRDPLTGYCAGPVKGEAGGNWSYNNCDYIVAGALLEAVTGKKWAKLVEERIAKPLGLKTLRAFPGGPQTRTGLLGGKIEPKIDFTAFGAGAALYGSPRELVIFDQALMSGKLLKQSELDQLWDGKPELGFIALGQWVFDAPLKDCAAPVKLVERRGSIGGVQVRNFIAPEKQAAIAIFVDKSENDFQFGEIWQGAGFSHDVLNFALCPKVGEKK